jgi:hypothetical protein
VILSGITTSLAINPPEEWDSAWNNQLIESVSDRQDKNAQKILKTVTISGSAATASIYNEGQL